MIGIIIQARLGSTRLPNKMVLPFYNNEGILEIILKKIQKEIQDIPLVVATTINSKDDEIIEVCKKNNTLFFRGSENNVLDRFIQTGNKYGFTKVIRICADNPFLDIDSLKDLINNFKIKDVDYYSYRTSDGTPTILTHFGFWAEGVSLNALKEVARSTNESIYLEHVTNYVHSKPEKFNLEFISIPIEIEKVTSLRMTLDTKEDFNLLKEIYLKCIKKEFKSAEDIVEYTKNNKTWLAKMQKQITLNTK